MSYHLTLEQQKARTRAERRYRGGYAQGLPIIKGPLSYRCNPDGTHTQVRHATVNELLTFIETERQIKSGNLPLTRTFIKESNELSDGTISSPFTKHAVWTLHSHMKGNRCLDSVVAANIYRYFDGSITYADSVCIWELRCPECRKQITETLLRHVLRSGQWSTSFHPEDVCSFGECRKQRDRNHQKWEDCKCRITVPCVCEYGDYEYVYKRRMLWEWAKCMYLCRAGRAIVTPKSMEYHMLSRLSYGVIDHIFYMAGFRCVADHEVINLIFKNTL